MFGTFSRSWELGKQSLAVLRHEKQLVVFPILSTLACLAVIASFAAPVLMTVDFEALRDDPQAARHPAYYLVLFAFYFANYFVIAFFNAALIACAMNRFNGEDTTVAAGLRAAGSRLPQILGWALVSATVGVVLRAIAERSGLLGRIIVGLIGMAWSIATYFVVPVLVVEGVGPITAVKRSTGILRKTWGEALVANAGIGGVTGLFLLLASLPLIGGVVLGVLNESVATAIVGVGLTIVLWILISLISSTLQVILVAALYRYASTGLIPEHFDGHSLRGMFRTK